MRVELVLLGTSSRWQISGGLMRAGRETTCEIALPPEKYPMVSREHAVFSIENGELRVTDRSTNGTFVNGTKISLATLKDRDHIWLGKDGPKLEVHIIDEANLASAPTVIGREGLPPASAPTVVSAGNVVHSSDAAAMPTRVARPEDLQRGPVAAAGKTNGPPVSPASGKYNSAISRDNELMIEQKLNSLRNLVYLLLAMVAVLLGVVFYQNQQIDKNRAELTSMRKQAQGAISQFTPALDQRISALDKRLETVDDKMKQTEEHFMNRMNTELPRMLDHYVDQKVKQINAAAREAAQAARQ